LIYEFLPVALAVGGLIHAIRQRDSLGILLGLWAGTAFVALWARPTDPPLAAVTVVLPAVLLAGRAVQALARRLWRERAALTHRALAAVGLGVWGFSTLALAYYAKQATPQYVLLFFGALAIQTLLAVGALYLSQAPRALDGLAGGWAVGLLLATLLAGWGASHTRAANPREIIVHQPTDPAVMELVRVLTEASWQRHGVPRRLEFTYVDNHNPVLRWYFRDFPHAVRAATPPPTVHAATEAAVVFIYADDPIAQPVPDKIGQDFALRRTWDPNALACAWRPVEGCSPAAAWLPGPAREEPRQSCAWYERLDCSAAVRWLLFRSAPLDEIAASDAVAVWLPGSADHAD
jgi:hypothetical protein